MQKSFGPWTIYEGGGYRHNPGSDNRNYWQTDAVVLRDISKTVSVGAEIFSFTAKFVGEESERGFYIGAIINPPETIISFFRQGVIFTEPT